MPKHSAIFRFLICIENRKNCFITIYDIKQLRVQDVMGMKQRKNIKLLNIHPYDRLKFEWEVNRRVQQELLDKKLMQWRANI